MKLCPTCKTHYPEDSNFCPLEACSTPDGPQRLISQAVAEPPARFQKSDRIGGSRTGAVFRAVDSQTGNQVALKIVASDVLTVPTVFARAEREFKQLAKISSPKIATIIDCSRTEDGKLMVAMELCEAESLETMVSRGPLDFEKAKSIVVQVGQALLEAQKAGLVHRAIATQNILVTASGDVKVINFPIARPINDKVAGVAAYLSPEQIQGKPIDQRSNTYSLAAVLYHLCTGETPFQAADEAALLEMQLSSPLLPPSQRRPGADLPANLDKLILKAMDKSSSRRHLTLRLFLTELETLKAAPYLSTSKETPVKRSPLAKTMMFAGSQSDVARIVAEAKAGKSTNSPVPATIEAPISKNQPVSQPTKEPASNSANAQPEAAKQELGVMQTIVASTSSPSLSASSSIADLPETPIPITPSIAPASVKSIIEASPKPAPVAVEPAQPSSAGKSSAPKAGAAFRETLWFKKGDVEQMVADAKAKMQATGEPASEAAAEVSEDIRPLEDRYVDDGSVTTEDRKKFSLRTGATATALPAAATSIPGEHINEQQMVGEIDRGRRTLILTVAFAIILAVVVVITMMLRGKGKLEENAPSPPPTTNTTLTTPPTPVPVVPSAIPAPPTELVPVKKPGSEPTPLKPPTADLDAKPTPRSVAGENKAAPGKKAITKKRSAKKNKKARQ